MQVKVYSTQHCTWCKHLKNFFKENNIEYTEIDVGANRDEAKKLVEKTQQLSVPQTEIIHEGKSQFIIGFNEEKLREALQL